jgi:hypothetical protein
MARFGESEFVYCFLVQGTNNPIGMGRAAVRQKISTCVCVEGGCVYVCVCVSDAENNIISSDAGLVARNRWGRFKSDSEAIL